MIGYNTIQFNTKVSLEYLPSKFFPWFLLICMCSFSMVFIMGKCSSCSFLIMSFIGPSSDKCKGGRSNNWMIRVSSLASIRGLCSTFFKDFSLVLLPFLYATDWYLYFWFSVKFLIVLSWPFTHCPINSSLKHSP